jgi:ABC-type amino acid transport substrate-binding protein
MKKIILILFLLALHISLWPQKADPNSQIPSRPFRIITEEDRFYAYYMLSGDKYNFENSQKKYLTGGDVEFIKELFQRLEIPYTIEVVPATNIIPMLKSGQADMALGIQKEKDISPIVNYPNYPMRSRNYVFYGRKEDQEKKIKKKTITYQDVIKNKFRVGITMGFTYPPEFWQAFDGTGQELNPLLIEKRDYVEDLGELRSKTLISLLVTANG